MAHADPPSFNCAIAKSAVEQRICHNPALAAADQKLNQDYQNTAAQAGIDPKALRRDEDAWLTNTRNKCTTDACIASAYAERDAQLLDESMAAASPAAYAETRPFTAPPPAALTALSRVGQACAALGWGTGAAIPAPFAAIPGFLPITLNGGTIWPAATGGTRFAFLLNTSASPCIVSDVATLPPSTLANEFLECFPAASSTLAGDGGGLGLRRSGSSLNIAYWDVDPGTHHLNREPLGVLALDTSGLTCQQPETGE